jgi:hypothetical protein
MLYSFNVMYLSLPQSLIRNLAILSAQSCFLLHYKKTHLSYVMYSSNYFLVPSFS